MEMGELFTELMFLEGNTQMLYVCSINFNKMPDNFEWKSIEVGRNKTSGPSHISTEGVHRSTGFAYPGLGNSARHSKSQPCWLHRILLVPPSDVRPACLRVGTLQGGLRLRPRHLVLKRLGAGRAGPRGASELGAAIHARSALALTNSARMCPLWFVDV